MLRRVYRTSGANPLVTRQRCGAAKASEELLAELDKVFESGSALNLCQAARLLDVSEGLLRRLAPDVAARLVQRGKETRRREKIQREAARFDDYWQSFQELRLENSYPAEHKGQARMYQHTGRILGSLEATRFHRKALHLAETAPRSSGLAEGSRLQPPPGKPRQVWIPPPRTTAYPYWGISTRNRPERGTHRDGSGRPSLIHADVLSVDIVTCR